MLEQRLKVVKARLPEPFKTLIIHFFNQDFFEKATVDRRRVFVKGCEIFTDFILNQEIKTPCQKFYDLVLSNLSHQAILPLVKFIDYEFKSFAINKKLDIPFNNLLTIPSDAELKNFYLTHSIPLAETPLEFLIGKALIDLRGRHESESTIGQFLHIYRLFYHYSLSKNSSSYDENIASQFLYSYEKKYINKEIKKWKFKMASQCIAGLKSIIQTGKLNFEQKDKIRFEYGQELVDVREKLMLAWNNRKLAKSTRLSLDYGFRKLLQITNVHSISKLKEITPFELQKSIVQLKDCTTTKASFNAIVGDIDIVLRELFKQGYTKYNLENCILRAKVINDYVSPYLSEIDQAKIFNYFSSNAISHRNKAIILLALQLGLRESDILNLKFENLDYKNKQIHLIQKKTQVPITLPLLSQIQDEIDLYLKFERPKFVETSIIFIRKQPPYTYLTDTHHIISRLLKKLQITPINKLNFGPHLLRHTFAKNLLDEQTSHQVITDSLGHISSNSDRYYISLEEEKLRECALGLNLIGFPLWMKEI